MSQFRNLVFEGGGVLGIAYAGAIEVLEQRGALDEVQRVAGTSAGAITAALLALGASGKTVEDIVGGTDFRSFMDNSWLLVDAGRLMRKYGWYKGDSFSQWLKRQISNLADGREDLTFGELADLAADRNPDQPYRRLFTIASNLSSQRPQVFSAETTPDMPIWLAVRMSMSIPLFFASVRHQKEVMVDGGVTWNYPIDLFDRTEYLSDVSNTPTFTKANYPTTYGDDHIYNKETLGFRVDTSDEIKAQKESWVSPPRKVDNLLQYSGVLLGFMLNMANKAHLHKNDWHRTVFLEADGVRFTDFNLSDEKVRMLVNSGRRCTETYFKWFDQPPEDDWPLNIIE